MLPESRGKTYILRILSIYHDLFRAKYGFVPHVNIGRFGKGMKNLIETHSELQIAALLIVFFNWRGMDGNSLFDEQRLINAGHNPQWFFSTVNAYETFIRNVLNVKFDDEEEVRKFVAKNMNELSTSK